MGCCFFPGFVFRFTHKGLGGKRLGLYGIKNDAFRRALMGYISMQWKASIFFARYLALQYVGMPSMELLKQE
ncbi:hypothetical protein EBT31_10365 [bacterium]|nr:hypothetical protein [bacterium]NBX50889.1 hypothetical protein [bacterium]